MSESLEWTLITTLSSMTQRSKSRRVLETVVDEIDLQMGEETVERIPGVYN